jgi:hypothetical protein
MEEVVGKLIIKVVLAGMDYLIVKFFAGIVTVERCKQNRLTLSCYFFD